MAHLAENIGVINREASLYAAIEVAPHPVGRGDIHLLLSAVGEDIDAGVLQEAPHDADGLDLLAKPLQPGQQAANAAYDKLDLYASLAGFIELVDHAFVFEAIHLQDGVGGLALAGVLDFALQERNKARASREGRYQQVLAMGDEDAALKQAEDLGGVIGKARVGRQQGMIGIDPGRVFVEVAGAQIGIVAQALPFLPLDEQQLGMHLDARVTVVDVGAGLSQSTAPFQIGSFVEAGLSFDKSSDGLALLAGFQQPFHHGRTGSGTIKRDFNVLNGRVVGRFFNQLDEVVKLVVGEVQNHIMLL